MISSYSPQGGSSGSVYRGPRMHTLQLAALMFVLYGIATVLNAVVFADVANSANVGDILRMPLPQLGAGLIAWGLLRRARWAWWAGLAFALSVLAAGILVISVFEHGDIYWLQPSTYQLFLVGGLLCAGAAVALLLAPGARGGMDKRAGVHMRNPAAAGG